MSGTVTPAGWVKLLVGLAIAFALFQVLASALGSERGEGGLVVAAAVVAALIVIERVLFRQSSDAAMEALGLGRPERAGLRVALGLSCALLAVLPIYAYVRGADLSAYPGWIWAIPGLFAQGGIAEEALFRGYLFRHLRANRSFWHAAALSTVPFVLVHLVLFATMPWPVALAAVLLSLIISFPLAYLFELGGGTIWAPALLHFTIQAAIKLVEIPGDTTLPLVWMAASAAIPWLAFLVRRPAPAP